MAAKDDKNIILVLAAIGVALLLVAGGWVWAWQHSSGLKDGISEARQTLASQKSRLDTIQKEHEEYEKGGTRDYYYRMLPNDGDDLPIETMRILADIEEESGAYILSGKQAKAGKSKKSPAAALYSEKAITIRLFTDYLGLVRFIEGIEKEVDRKAVDGGGRLFEVKGVKTAKKSGDKEGDEESATSVRPGWKMFDIDVSMFTWAPRKK